MLVELLEQLGHLLELVQLHRRSDIMSGGQIQCFVGFLAASDQVLHQLQLA